MTGMEVWMSPELDVLVHSRVHSRVLLHHIQQDIEVLLQDRVGGMGSVGDPVAVIATALEHPVQVQNTHPKPGRPETRARHSRRG